MSIDVQADLATPFALYYELDNRSPLEIDFPGDTDTIYTYDTCVNGKGRLCSMADASGTTSYEYSPKGQVKKETKIIDSHTYINQYTYDQNGNMKTMTYPSGKVITYNYTNDRAVSVLNGAANLATNIAYKPFGGMSTVTYGNGLSSTVGYDSQYRITGITAGAVMSLSYLTYDNNGNIQAIQDLLDPAKNKSFTYDALDRLSTGTASGIWGSLGWTYDGVGNRLTENGNSYTYAPNTNKLTSANGISFGYDNNGNTTTQSARIYTYNQNQRLIQVADGAMTANYSYNGNGQRVKKNVNGTVTIFHYSLNGQIIAESTSAGTVTAEYVYLNGQPLAKMEGASTYYYHNDHLSTPQKMTDASGVVVWFADYKPFGEAAINPSSTITNNLRFPGQYYDAETALNYNYSRDYNPIIGRYITADRIGLSGGINLYAYVGMNPISRTDRKGLDYWIEGPSPGEPAGHLSLSVGDPNGAYKSYSFGVTGQGFFEGEVYEDINPGGKILPASYRRTTAEQDEMINQYLSSLVGTPAPYRPWRTCRSFSFDQFSVLEDSSLAGKSIVPPVRSVSPKAPKTHPGFPLSTAATERW